MVPIVLPFHVDQSWYTRTWLTERALSRAARLSLRTRLVARRLARTMSAVVALHTSLLQQASDSSESFR